MFKVFDRKKKQLDLLENPISPVITNELGGIGELTFSVPSTYKHLELEGYIQVENDHEYVIKEIVTHGTNRDIVCMLNIEEILGMAWSKFISRDNTLMKCAELVLNGTGWRAVDKSSCNVKRNLYGTVTNSYNLLQMMCTVYNVEFIFDTYNKVVTFVDKVGKDAGVYFMKDINLKQLNVDTHTHKYITRVIPVGKDGLTIESVNGGKNYLENKTYTTKNIYGIWQSDKHDNPKALMDDARRFLDEMAIPYETYEVVVDDLYALKGYEEFEYGLGDIVTIIDGDTETRVQQRIIQRTYNLLEPDKDTIHIANKDATFEDYYKRLQTIADMTQSVIGSDGTINGGSISDGTVSGDKITSGGITSDHIQSGSITSTHIKAEQILADHIMSNQITTNHLVAECITSDHIQANAIHTQHLRANSIHADHIQSNTIGTNHLQANSITAGSGIIAEGAIGNAQISKIDAGKIEAGTIDTSKVTVQGANGHLRLKGNRMQVFDGVGNQAKERVSVGDVNGDGTVFGLRVRGADGQTVLLDENGVTSEGITDGSITNDKVSDNANIDGAKLNIDSVISSINNDGTEVIRGTKIEVDGTNLGVKLSEITNKQTEDSERITQAYSKIEANEKAIKLKVDEQTYIADKNDMTSKLEKNTSEISAMKGQIALKVEQTDIDNMKNAISGEIDTKIFDAKAEIKATTDSISNTLYNGYYTKEDVDYKDYQISSQAKQEVDRLQIKFSESGGYNLFKNSSFKNELNYWGISGDASDGVISILNSNGHFAFKDDNINTIQIFMQDKSNKEFGIKQDVSLVVGKVYSIDFFANGSDCGWGSLILECNGKVEHVLHFDPLESDGGGFNKWMDVDFSFTATTENYTIKIVLKDAGNNGHMWIAKPNLVEGIRKVWTPNPNEVYDGITTIDKDGIEVKATNSSTYTEMDASSFRVNDNNGGTVAEFAKSSIIPYLNSGEIHTGNLYANNVPKKETYSSNIHFIYVNGSTGNDTNNGTSTSPYKTVQRAIDDISDIQHADVTIYVYNSVQGFVLRGITGSGVITFSLQDSAIINGGVWLHGVENRVRIVNETSSRKATLKAGMSIDDCRNVDLYCLTFRGTNNTGNNITINNTNYCAVNSCDLGGLSTQLLCAIRVQASLLWVHGCIGSNITDVVGQYAFSHVLVARAGTSNVPDYSNMYLCNYDGAGRIHNWSGGDTVKTPSSGWNPSYTPTQKTRVWSFNKIWSDETLHGWSDRQELIQGYSSTWNTGRWTGYIQMTDGMASVRNVISGGTNLSGRIYIQRTSSSGNATGSKLCLYASDGTLITNSTSINRGQGVWVSLSSSIMQKIQSGAITYFYLKADTNNNATYFKCESNAKIEITYTN